MSMKFQMLKSSNEDVYKVPYNMMLKSGIWPKEYPTLVYKIKTFLSWFFAIGLLVVQLMQAINDIKDFAKLSETLYIMVAVLGYIIKLGVFTYRKEKFLEMVNFLKGPIFTSYPDEYDHFMKKNIKYASLAANTLKYFFMSCVVLYLIFPIIDQVPLPFPFPYELGRYTFVMYAFQIAAEGYAAWNNACIDTLCTCMMGVAVAQLEILSEKIIHIKKDHAQLGTYEISERKEEIAVRRIRQCVQHHLAIMRLKLIYFMKHEYLNCFVIFMYFRYIEYVEGIFGLGIFLQFTISALVICNTLFHFLLVSNFYDISCV